MITFNDIVKRALQKGPKRVAVAGHPEEELVLALDRAERIGLVKPLIFDDAMTAVAAVRAGEADLLMKGSTSTGETMKAILDHDGGLRSGHLISHIAVCEVKGRLLLITDAGIVPNPTLEEKAEIIRNAVPVARALGIDVPKVAVLAAVEKVNPKMPETVDAEALSTMDFDGCVVQGPLALDNAVSRHAAELKHIAGPVAGQADVLLVPSVAAGNIFAKSIMYFVENVRFGGVLAGTTHPVAMLSRSDSAATRLDTLALGVLMS